MKAGDCLLYVCTVKWLNFHRMVSFVLGVLLTMIDA